MNLELVDEFVIFWFQKRTVCNGALLLLFKLDHFFWANTSCDCQKSWDGKFFLQNFDKHRHLNLYNRNLCLGRMTETALTQLFELVQGLADETIGLKGLEKLPDGGCQRSVPCQLSLKTYPLRSWQIWLPCVTSLAVELFFYCFSVASLPGTNWTDDRWIAIDRIHPMKTDRSLKEGRLLFLSHHIQGPCNCFGYISDVLGAVCEKPLQHAMQQVPQISMGTKSWEWWLASHSSRRGAEGKGPWWNPWKVPTAGKIPTASNMAWIQKKFRHQFFFKVEVISQFFPCDCDKVCLKVMNSQHLPRHFRVFLFKNRLETLRGTKELELRRAVRAETLRVGFPDWSCWAQTFGSQNHPCGFACRR